MLQPTGRGSADRSPPVHEDRLADCRIVVAAFPVDHPEALTRWLMDGEVPSSELCKLMGAVSTFEKSHRGDLLRAFYDKRHRV